MLSEDAPLPAAPMIESEDWRKWQAVDGAGAAERLEGGEYTWQDWALLYGAETMLEMRTAVKDRLGYTCSAVSRLNLFSARRS
jgi:hypothetical protein